MLVTVLHRKFGGGGDQSTAAMNIKPDTAAEMDRDALLQAAWSPAGATDIVPAAPPPATTDVALVRGAGVGGASLSPTRAAAAAPPEASIHDRLAADFSDPASAFAWDEDA